MKIGAGVTNFSDERSLVISLISRGPVNQHTPVHHPLNACCYSVMGEPQLS
jgi:hypothetical protein